MKTYLITDPNYYTNNTNEFTKKLNNVLNSNKIDYICFRDKISKNYEQLAKIFVNITKEHNIKNIFINKYINLAYKLNITGVHLTSEQINQITYAKSLNLKIILSCHNEDDIKIAIKNNIDYITYSPIFDTPNKGKAKGIENLIYILNKYPNIKIFALGGIISSKHIDLLKQSDVYGFSSIRYFI